MDQVSFKGMTMGKEILCINIYLTGVRKMNLKKVYNFSKITTKAEIRFELGSLCSQNTLFTISKYFLKAKSIVT